MVAALKKKKKKKKKKQEKKKKLEQNLVERAWAPRGQIPHSTQEA